MNEGGKGLWHNIRQRRKKGLPKRRPGQKGYPKTLDIGESVLRDVIRQEIVREWSIGQALMSSPGQLFDGIVGILKDMFGPTTAQRLARAGDDKILQDLIRKMESIHTLPEYRVAWENVKAAQQRRSTNVRDYDPGRDPASPVGETLRRLMMRIEGYFDDAAQRLSPQNEDIWGRDLEQSRAGFQSMWEKWERGSLTTAGLLRSFDPKGINEARLHEVGEMFAGKDLEQMQTTELVVALETALMNLEDIGCPDGSDARVITDQVIDMVEKMRNRPDYDTSMLPPVVNRAVYAIRTCKHIPPREAEHIARNVEMALNSSQEIDRF
jgi:hypothetical protein